MRGEDVYGFFHLAYPLLSLAHHLFLPLLSFTPPPPPPTLISSIQLSDKDVSLLEERIRRSGKRPAPPPSANPPASGKAQEQDKKQAQE